MNSLIKKITFITVNSIFNIGIFLGFYNYLVSPLLHEEQRMDIAPYIFMYVFPGYIIVSILSVFIFRVLFTRN